MSSIDRNDTLEKFYFTINAARKAIEKDMRTLVDKGLTSEMEMLLFDTMNLSRDLLSGA